MPSLPKISAPVLCPTFEKEAEKIWDDYGAAYGMGLIRDEETITNDLLLNIARAHPWEVITWQFHQGDEKLTGADWEWWLTNGASWLGLLIQAKRLDPKSHRYKQIKHKVGKAKTPQIELLIATAAGKGIDPLYFFYNYSPSPQAAFTWNCCKHPLKGRQYGCTAAHAFAVKQMLNRGGAGLPKMSQISLPMRCLVCCPVLSDPDHSLPGRANGVTKELKSLVSRFADIRPPEATGPRAEPPSYVRRLLDTPPDERRRVIEELRDEVGPIGSLVVIKDRPQEHS